MASQIEGVTERLMECATGEFLNKGFQDASLRAIAQNAQTSTSSIYVRFGDKAGLFRAITDSACNAFLETAADAVSQFNAANPGMSFDEMVAHKTGAMTYMVDVIYAHFDAFRLLALKAEGSAFKDFIRRVADIEIAQTIRYIESTHNDALSSGRLTNELLHTLSCAYWTGAFEMVVQNLSKEEALLYFAKLRRFFRHGWQDLFFAKE